MPETRKSAENIAPQISLRRRFTDHAMTGVAVLTVVLVMVPLFAIFTYLVYRGVGSINWAFLTQTPKPVGEAGGGMANAIVGSDFHSGAGECDWSSTRSGRGNLFGGVWAQPLW